MTNHLSRAFIVVALASTAIALPAHAVPARARPAPVAGSAASGAPAAAGLAIANIEGIVTNSSAFRAAQQQRAITYKPQIDQAEARRAAVEAQLKPLADKYNTDHAAAGANQAALAQQLQMIQGIQQSAQQEIQTIMQPFALSQAYVNEQIEGKLGQAINTAMAKARVSLLLNPQAVITATSNAYSLDQAILIELNALMPAAQLVPPAGWQPREVREQQAQQQQAQAPAAPQSPGR